MFQICAHSDKHMDSFAFSISWIVLTLIFMSRTQLIGINIPNSGVGGNKPKQMAVSSPLL